MTKEITRPLIIIKLGGSVITNKKENKLEFYNKKISRITKEIIKAKKQKKFSLIILHGVGPYGHKLVKEYDINNGIKTALQKKGFQKAHQSVCELNNKIIRQMKKRLPLQNFIPLNLFITKNKRIIKAQTVGIIQALQKNKIPLLFGDMVKDQELTGTPLSSDTIAAFLAQKLNAELLLFGTDVNGVYNQKKEIIQEINKNNYDNFSSAITGSKHIDVSGGMKKKIDSIKEYNKNYTTYIFNLNKKNNIYNNLIGKYNGTKINLKD